MSRSCYSDDYGYDFPGQLELYRSNVRRSIRSKAGQARLLELKRALESMPNRALGKDEFLPSGRNACALGVWAAWKTQGTDNYGKMASFQGDDHETADLLRPYQWPRLLVLDLVFENDEQQQFNWVNVDGPHVSPYPYYERTWRPVAYRVEITDEERYQRVLDWVNSNLATVEAR